MSDSKVPRRRNRGSIFFALLLVILGVIFLLSNTGVIQGDVWSLIAQFWPLLLVVIGLDSIYKREGLVAPTFLIGIGVIFLLANLGYLSVNIWQMVLTLWPILLIAIGFDILIGRRSVWAAIAGMILILVILAGSLWLFGVSASQASSVQGETIQQSLDGATRAEVKIEPAAGDIQIGATSLDGILIEGSVPTKSSQNIESSYTVSGGVGTYLLRETGSRSFLPGQKPGQMDWNLDLTDAVPLDLTLQLGAGNLQADLSTLDLDNLSVNTAVGNSEVILPAQDGLVAEIEGAIGQFEVTVPDGVGVQLQADTALVTLQVPPDFVRVGEAYQSPGYPSASQRIDLVVKLAIGNVVIRTGR
jgi:hypothetical protein